MAGLFPSVRGGAEPTHFARVAVERGIDRRGAALTYALGDEAVMVGERVEVPLGKGDKRAAGIVVTIGGRELLDGLDPDRVKRILRRTGSRLPEKLVELGAWIADYYVCPVGMVLSAMTPAAVKHGTGRTTRAEVELGPGGLGAEPPAGLKPAPLAAWTQLRALEPGVLPLAPKGLAQRLGLKSLGPINRLVDAGLMRVVQKEMVRVRDAAWDRLEVESRNQQPVTELSAAQRTTTDGIAATLGGFAVHLIRGVTGSGKTEVYLRLIDGVLAAGGTAIVLVPEIALTPQTAGRFLARFRDRGVAVLHSGLSAAHRHRQWAMAASGEARVIVGARSATFAPVRNLGLIVVDEEHDSSGYKQEQLPRYHGRDVAIKRAQMEGCPIVLGSATPSLESWANASGPNARYRLWELPDRVGPGRLPRVEVVDLAQERRARLQSGASAAAGRFMIGPRLESALAATLSAGGQAILLLNRRGYSSYLACPDTRCGFVARCEHCDAAMVLHRAGHMPPGGLIRCHHCLAEQLVPRACPVCGRRPVPLGIGIQQAEEELGAMFGPSHGLIAGESMVRADGDTMRTARDYFRVLARFAEGSIRVLVGTQIISKGLDYPNVRLVGVINADTALALPDFRAAERTFQLISQVAGRAGRGSDPGLVIVQTFNPNEPAIALAAQHDFVSFAQGELGLRRAAGLPPATRMARIVVRDKDAKAAQESAAELARLLKGVGGPVRLLGPAPCPISRIGGYHRVGIELIAPTAPDLHRPLAALRSAGLLKSDARTAVDVDPAGLM